jgi:hypothetical protein
MTTTLALSSWLTFDGTLKHLVNEDQFTCSFFLAMIFSCITKSRYQKAADEIAAKMPPSHNMNVGKEKYNLYR